MHMSGMLARNISGCLRIAATRLIELEIGKHIRYYHRTETRLHLHANDVNSGPFSVYRNKPPQTL